MNRAWFLLLAVSIGLNAAMIYQRVAELRGPRPETHRERRDEGRDGRRGPGSGEQLLERRLERMSEQLGLSGAQREAIRAIQSANFEAIGAHRDEMRTLRQALRTALSGAQLDSLEIRRIGGDMRLAQAQTESLITLNMIREAAILTPEQRARYPGLMPWDREGGRRDRGRTGR